MIATSDRLRLNPVGNTPRYSTQTPLEKAYTTPRLPHPVESVSMQPSVTTQAQSPPSLNDEVINLRDLFYIFWRDRWMFISVIAACTLTAGAVALLLPKEYEASVLVSPVASSAGGGQMSALSSLATQFGGLASLAGVSVSGDSRRSESVAVLQSEALTEQYIQANNLLPVLFRKKWDTVKEKWTTTDPTEIPTLWKANRLFIDRIRKVSTETKTGLVTIAITWTDPTSQRHGPTV